MSEPGQPLAVIEQFLLQLARESRKYIQEDDFNG